jgi:nucleotide-binding universal stress UspA family protein
MISVWKDIAVFLDATAEGAKVGRHAAALASRHNAHLVGIYGVSHSATHPAESYARGSQAISDVISRTRLADEAKALTAARHFGSLAEEFGLSSEFRLVWQGGSGDEGALRALHCDLLVAAQPKPADLPDTWSAERLLLTTGTPVLLVPTTSSGDTIGTRVLIAWNRSREARRALNDALPFITTAEAVTVLTVDGDRHPELFGSEAGVHVVEHLARHGARASVSNVASDGASTANTILSQAVAVGADLLVIGAYSHPRTSELLFGGVTRSLLADTRLPMLISR